MRKNVVAQNEEVQTQRFWRLYNLSWWYLEAMWQGVMGGEGRDRSSFSDLAKQFVAVHYPNCVAAHHINIHTHIPFPYASLLPPGKAGLPQELTKHSAASSMKPSWKRCSSLKVSAKAWRRLSEGRARSRLCWNWEKMPWRREQGLVCTWTGGQFVYQNHLCHPHCSIRSLDVWLNKWPHPRHKRRQHSWFSPTSPYL